VSQLLPISNPMGTDSEMLDRLRRETFDFFRHETNPANGFVPDRTQPGSPSSIAAVEMGLSVYSVAVERELLSRMEAVRLFHSQNWWIVPHYVGVCSSSMRDARPEEFSSCAKDTGADSGKTAGRERIREAIKHKRDSAK